MKTRVQQEIIFKVKTLREQHAISQATLAEIIDSKSSGLVGNIESKKFPQKYTLRQLKLISDYFKVRYESFFMTDDELKKPKKEALAIFFKKVVEYVEP